MCDPDSDKLTAFKKLDKSETCDFLDIYNSECLNKPLHVCKIDDKNISNGCYKSQTPDLSAINDNLTKSIENKKRSGGIKKNSTHNYSNECNKLRELEYYYESKKQASKNEDEFLSNTTADCYISPKKIIKNSKVTSIKNSKVVCIQERCSNVDQIIEKFKDTQYFIDSLDKHSGVTGLGLIDPFFEADIEYKKPAKIRMTSQVFAQQYDTVKPLNFPALPYKSHKNPPRESRTDIDLNAPRFQRFFMNTVEGNEIKEGDDEERPCRKSTCHSKLKKNSYTVANSLDVTQSLHKNIEIMKLKKSKKKKEFSGSRAGNSRLASLASNHYIYLTCKHGSNAGTMHEKCLNIRKRIPGNMGWLWNHQEAVQIKLRPGWRPGAMSRNMREIIKETKASMTKKTKKLRPIYTRGTKILKTNKSTISFKKNHKLTIKERDTEPPATLTVQRRDKTYYVTMYPIKQNKTNELKLEKQMKPFHFKFVPTNDDASDESLAVSDLEIEFSPPAIVYRYEKNPDVVHIDTQVKKQDIIDAAEANSAEQNKNKKIKKSR
ncbi:uncharacterized protein LOC122853851 [Aphidius gifuensis]|uniref:uncharacterized protein LOC122853851 n=1 Tax=Aphidius gifuensis TaxID=684658 RepID=UPI001CDD7634|nr:uncharacterized protein LOC122853851 [Aphidius gifuensis]